MYLVFYLAAAGYFVLPLSWRWFVFIAGLPNAILLICRLFWKWESPRFLIGQGKIKEASYILEQMAKANGKCLPPGQLIAPGPVASKEIRPWYASFVDIWMARLLAPVLTMSVLFFGQTFGYYGLMNWMRKLVIAKGITDLSLCFLYTCVGLAEIPGLLFTTALIKTKGRKLVFLTNFVGSAASSLLLVFVQGRTSFLIVSSMTYFFIVGSWTALYVTTPELFPTSIRASCFAIAHCSGKIAGALSPLFFGVLWDLQVNALWILLIIASSFVLAAITSAFLLVETSGRALQDTLSPTMQRK